MIVFSLEDRRRILDMIEENCKVCLFPRLKPRDVEAVKAHIAKMRADPRQFGLEFKFEAPNQYRTEIKMIAYFNDSIPDQPGGMKQ